MARARYQDWLTPEGLTLLEGWARAGLTLEQIAKNAGCSVRTLYVWREKYPPIMQAIKKGAEVVDFEVESALYRRAMGYEVEDEKRYIQEVDGKKTVRREVTKRHVPGDTTAMIFWLKNRKPAQWRDRPDDNTGHGVVNIIDDI